MPSASSRSLISRARPVAVLLIAALVLAGCVGSGPGGSGGPSSSPASSAAPSSPASGGGFYMRAWQTQALAPQNTFSWLSPVTISDGQFIDGNIAIPAIYPGPIYSGPQSRPISDAGIAAIVAAMPASLIGRDWGPE